MFLAMTDLESQEKKKKYEPPVPPPRVGTKQRKRDQGAALGTRLPTITPNAKCKLRLLKLERVKDYLLMEEEWVKTQELLKPHEERNEEDRSKVRFPVLRLSMHLSNKKICRSWPANEGLLADHPPPISG